MRIIAAALTFALSSVALLRSAEARVDIRVDLASQTMQVDGASGTYVWPISSARTGFSTPHGRFRVQRMEAMHRSHKYHDSPMPHSLFFTGGYAIHGTYSTASLGRPASHGCIRIAPENAAALFEMVRAEGAEITILGQSPPESTRYAAARTRDTAPRANRVYASRRMPGRGLTTRGLGLEPDLPLAYAPLVAPGFYRWLDDPVDY